VVFRLVLRIELLHAVELEIWTPPRGEENEVAVLAEVRRPGLAVRRPDKYCDLWVEVELFHLTQDQRAIGRARYREHHVGAGALRAQDHWRNVRRARRVLLVRRYLVAARLRFLLREVTHLAAPVGVLIEEGDLGRLGA